MSADEAPAERLHPLALLSGLGKAARNLVGALFAGGYFAFQGRPEVALLILGTLGIAIFGGLLLNWLTFSYRVGEDAVRIDSGILSRNHRTIPFDRVQDVSIAQGPVQRLAGVAQVTLETGGSNALSEEGVLAAVALSRAEALRDLVRARRMGLTLAGGGNEQMLEPAGEAEPVFAMDLKRVLTCGLFNFSLAVLAALFGASQTIGDLFRVDPFERDFWRPILLENGLGQYLLDHRLGLAVGGIAVLVLLGVATGLVRTLLHEYGFRLDRTPKGLRRRRGLTTRTDVSLPKRRIQAGVIATGPVRERFGWRAFSVQSLAGDRAENGNGLKGDHVLAPLATEAEIAPIAAELGYALPDETTGWRPVAKAHVWSFLVLLVPVLLILAGAATVLIMFAGEGSPSNVASSVAQDAEGRTSFPAAIGLGLFALFAACRWLEWKRTAFALEGERLMIRTGWWSRRTLILPLKNVQSVDLRETALSRRFGVAHLVIDIAGGSAMGNVVPSLPRKEASLLRAELLSRQP